jgi:hypothetical protein
LEKEFVSSKGANPGSTSWIISFFGRKTFMASRFHDGIINRKNDFEESSLQQRINSCSQSEISFPWQCYSALSVEQEDPILCVAFMGKPRVFLQINNFLFIFP